MDYQPFLQDWYAARKAAWKNYSYEQLCRKLGRSRTYAYYIVQGIRPLTVEGVAAVVGALELSEDEAWYLGELVVLSQMTSAEARRQHLVGVLDDDRYQRGRSIEPDGSAIFSRYLSWWVHPALVELVKAGGFREEAAWIAQRFRASVAEEEIADAITFLLGSGFLVRDETGALQASENWLQTEGEARGEAVYKYHYDLLDNARHALEDPPEQRHLTGATLLVDRGQLEQLKVLINEFVREAAAVCEEAPTDGGEVFQLSVQLFSLTETV